MALIRPESVDDSTQSSEMDFTEKKNEDIEINDSNAWAKNGESTSGPQGISSIASVKSEPVESSLEDWDGCGRVVKNDFDESENGNELENPIFVTVKEEVDDETLLDQGTFKLSDSAQGPITDSSRVPRDACCAMAMLDLESLNCCHHCNSIGVQGINQDECLMKARTQCLCKMTLKLENSTECMIPLGITSTSEVKEIVYERVDDEGKLEQSEEMQVREMENKKSIYMNHGGTSGKLSVAGHKETEGCPLNTSSHSGRKTFKCSQCEKVFTKKSSLFIHMRTHTGERPFQCDQCGKSFTQRSNLTTHLRQHTGEKPFKCNRCERTFFNSANLTIHTRQHTGEKPFSCNHCGKAFNQSYHLTIHMRQHTGEKPFKCNQCGKAFHRSDSLMIHMRQHTGEKPFQCNQCGNAYGQKGHLTTHIRQHTGEKPYKCNVCKKAFAIKRVLTRHVKTHTSK